MNTTLFDTAQNEVTTRLILDRIVFNENGRIIAKAHIQATYPLKSEAGKPVTHVSILGAMPNASAGQEYEVTGKLEYDTKWHQWQIKFSTHRTILPNDEDSILRYLIDVARWVGPDIAAKLVKAFGNHTLTTIKTDPEHVAETIPGITLTRAKEMQSTLVENEKSEQAMIEINTMIGGVLPPSITRKAISTWGSDAALKIKDNPFILTSLPGVGFIMADAIHRRMKGAEDDQNRHKSAIVHVLQEAAQNDGHTVITTNQAVLKANILTGGLRTDSIATAEKNGHIRTSDMASDMSLEDLVAAEEYVAGKISTMLSEEMPPTRIETTDTTLNNEQRAAFHGIQNSNVFILTGAPGTGKTYTLARIVKALRDTNASTVLVAPTGKAAKQMELALQDTCPTTATTIHSALGPTIDEDGNFCFDRDEHDPIPADVIIADEFSMVDVRLARSLLKAISPTTKLIIVGDHYQLPSIGPGAVLRDLIAAKVPCHELSKIQRNAGLIVKACHAIKAGKIVQPAEKLDADAGQNWRHIETESTAQTKQVIEALLRDKLPGMGIDTLWNVQLISPTNEKGELSCQQLNKLAKQIINPTPPPFPRIPFAHGDKVVRLRNGTAKSARGAVAVRGITRRETGATAKEDVRIVNGDVGIVHDIDDKHVIVEFRYPDRKVEIKKGDHKLKMAYAMTGHKMQGSEVPIVVLPLHKSYSRMPMVNREWLYTAMSRAKQALITVGDLGVMRPIISKVGMQARQTTLASKVKLQ